MNSMVIFYSYVSLPEGILRDFKGIYMGTSASKFPSVMVSLFGACTGSEVAVGVNSYPLVMTNIAIENGKL